MAWVAWNCDFCHDAFAEQWQSIFIFLFLLLIDLISRSSIYSNYKWCTQNTNSLLRSFNWTAKITLEFVDLYSFLLLMIADSHCLNAITKTIAIIWLFFWVESEFQFKKKDTIDSLEFYAIFVTRSLNFKPNNEDINRISKEEKNERKNAFIVVVINYFEFFISIIMLHGQIFHKTLHFKMCNSYVCLTSILIQFMSLKKKCWICIFSIFYWLFVCVLCTIILLLLRYCLIVLDFGEKTEFDSTLLDNETFHSKGATNKQKQSEILKKRALISSAFILWR